MSSTDRGARLGTRFGPYELRSLIGVGGMGEVYEAYDTIKGRSVALKVLRRELAADPSFQERFWRECRMTARLQDPHVVPVHDFGSIDGVLFIDMRLVKGASLRDLLDQQGALEPKRAARITAQVAAALDAAHADGLVHRDVKPENVLITRDDFAYLVDFGIAHAGGDPSVTTDGTLVGSSAYMAPERFNGGRLGPQTDVYSLTCVLYECLAGQPPFEGEALAQLVTAHMFAPPPRPSIMRRGVGRAFDEVIAAGLAKQSAARIPSAGALARAATAAASGDPMPEFAPAPVAVSPSPPPAPKMPTRPFTSIYPNPDTTGFSPYPMPPPEPARRNRGPAPFIFAGAAVVVLFVAAAIAGMAVLLGGGHKSPPAASTWAAPPPPTTTSPKALSRPVQGADSLGFVGHTARCEAGNPPASVVRTAKSLVVVCENDSGNFYYRGERIRDGANIQLRDAVRSAGGFDVTNPSDGTRYEVRPQRLRIISNGHVDSSEPVLQYASAD
jgi:serine/threonine protein kinase